MKTLFRTVRPVVLTCLLAAACDGPAGSGGGDTDGGGAQSEQITRVELTLSPDTGGTPVVAAFSDPDGDGGASGTSDPITLSADTTYALSVTFANELADPAEDVTAEIEAEAEEHQIFFYGDAVDGLLTHAYADMESSYGSNDVGDDLPVGLANTITTAAAGTGTLRVRLQHMPPVNDTPVKEAGLADAFPSLPGEPDADVSFDVTVQ
jgi:hypothetical protein